MYGKGLTRFSKFLEVQRHEEIDDLLEGSRLGNSYEKNPSRNLGEGIEVCQNFQRNQSTIDQDEGGLSLELSRVPDQSAQTDVTDLQPAANPSLNTSEDHTNQLAATPGKKAKDVISGQHSTQQLLHRSLQYGSSPGRRRKVVVVPPQTIPKQDLSILSRQQAMEQSQRMAVAKPHSLRSPTPATGLSSRRATHVSATARPPVTNRLNSDTKHNFSPQKPYKQPVPNQLAKSTKPSNRGNLTDRQGTMGDKKDFDNPFISESARKRKNKEVQNPFSLSRTVQPYRRK